MPLILHYANPLIIQTTNHPLAFLFRRIVMPRREAGTALLRCRCIPFGEADNPRSTLFVLGLSVDHAHVLEMRFVEVGGVPLVSHPFAHSRGIGEQVSHEWFSE